MNKVILDHDHIRRLAQELSYKIIKLNLQFAKAYPIPRGGVPAAYATYHPTRCPFVIVNTPEEADFFIDDIIDSGHTMEKYCDEFPARPFVALIDKTAGEYDDAWVVFPWEGSVEGSIEENIIRLLEYVGEDPNRGGLLETPHRVAKAWAHWCGGYSMKPQDVLKTFEDGAEKHDQMVTVKEIPFYSHCEHHMAPFFGTVTISYIPNGKIVGLSKLSRLADMFARRLQVQERLTDQIADALMEHLSPIGVGVMIKARHMCMESRGTRQQGHHTITTALRGVMKSEHQTRSEFLRLAD